LTGRLLERLGRPEYSCCTTGWRRRKKSGGRVRAELMEIDLHAIEESTIEDFAEKHGLRMQVYERSNRSFPNPLPKYFAYFYGAEISDGAILNSIFGDGNTPEEAIANYADQISEKVLTFDAWLSTRYQIFVPRLVAKSDRLKP